VESPFVGDSEMAGRMRTLDWAGTPAGPSAGWPAALRTAVALLLRSRLPMYVAWGPQQLLLYNDAYAPLLGARHPRALGAPFADIWPEVWPGLQPVFRDVLAGTSVFQEDLLMVLERRGWPEEAYFTFSLSGIGDDEGAGVFCTCTETTRRVVGERRLLALGELGELGGAADVEAACTAAVEVLSAHRADVPAALLYLLDHECGSARLVAAEGVDAPSALAPTMVELGSTSFWASVFREVTASGTTAVVPGLADALPDHPPVGRPDAIGAAESRPIDTAVALPVRIGGEPRAGVLVAVASPYLPLDGDYRAFVELLGHHVSTAASAAAAFAAQRRRAEELAELDRAKTAFFTGISHEFRTPLTLILGPVAELRDGAPRGSPLRADLELVHRNGQRLSRLVDRLLELSRLQAGRVDPRFELIDLAALTADLAGMFRSAVERAGLALEVDCPDLGEPVVVDRAMWEEVVLNLLSNALKFTFDGTIAVSLRAEDGAAVLRVGDTGTGIPPDELPRLFERFHRVGGARARSAEGSGIGLALVAELVGLHGGTVEAASPPGVGTTMTVAVPLGRTDRVAPDRRPDPAERRPVSLDEALWWMPDGPDATEPTTTERPDRARVLVADDNADMRAYVVRLLSTTYSVRAVADGAAALAAALADPPDLVLTEVAMAGSDGLALLAALREDPRTSVVPVVLMSARAGPEAAVEGLDAGADDYLVKPFSARELRARVDTRVALGRARREAERRFRAMADSTPALIWADGPGGRRLFVNQGWLEFTGAEPDTDLGLAWHERIHPADRERYAAVRAAAGGGPFEVEYRLRRADGRYRWVLDRGAPAEGYPGGYVGGCLDIHTRSVERRRQRLLAVVGAALDRETTVAGRRMMLVRTVVDEGLVDLARFVTIEQGRSSVTAIAAGSPEQEATLRRLDVDWMHAREAVASGELRRFEVDEAFILASTPDERQRELRRGVGFATIVLIPLRARGGVSGLLAVARTVGSEPFDDDDLPILADLGERAATAMDNALLLEREQATRARLELLQHATAALSAAATPEQVATTAVEQFAALSGATAVTLWRLSGTGDALEALDLDGPVPAVPGTRGQIALLDGAAPAEAARTHDPVWADPERGDRVPDCVPLVAAGTCVGVVGLAGHPRDLRTGAGRAALTVLAKLCAQALQRAGLLTAEHAARRAAEELGEVVGALSGATTPGDVAEVVLDHVVRLGATSAAVLLRSTEHLDVLASRAGRGPALRDRRLPLSSAHPAARAVRSGEPVWEGAEPVAVPLVLGGPGRPLGVIALWFDRPRSFSAQERAAVLTLAGQCAQALDRARLHQVEHDVADVLQHSLLPSELPVLSRLDVAARYLPSAVGVAAGGDWYDLLPVDESRVALVVGDVVGHGAAAAAVMGQLRSALAAYLLDGHSPAEALERLDRFARRVPGAIGSTCVCMVLDCATGELCWARAGHPPALLLEPSGPRYLEEGGGAVLGVTGRPPYPQARVVVEPGSCVLLYTDGLVERRGEVIDAGQARLARTAAAVRDLPPEELVSALDAALAEGVLGDTAQPDDVALVAVRLVPAPLHGRLPAQPAQLRMMRRAVEAWAATAGLSDDVLDDLQYTLGEAAANAVEHAYEPGRAGEFAYAVEYLPGVEGGVAVEVHDEGRWRPVPGDPGHRGRGLQVLEALGHDVRIERGHGGTTVTFRIPRRRCRRRPHHRRGVGRANRARGIPLRRRRCSRLRGRTHRPCASSATSTWTGLRRPARRCSRQSRKGPASSWSTCVRRGS
jgi:PAS domain S-box-containing protein